MRPNQLNFSFMLAAVALLPAIDIAMADLGVPIGGPQPLNTNAPVDTGLDLRPSIASDGQGNWVAVWTSNNSFNGTPADSDIFFARSVDGGQNWSLPAPLNTNATTDSGIDGEPKIATDGVGHWVVVWNTTDVLGGTIAGQFNILVSRSTNNGANWTPPAALNSNSNNPTGRNQTPHIATGGDGNWITVWISNDPLGNTIGSDYDILFARSIDNGEHWSAAAPLSASGATDGAAGDHSPFVVINAQGVAVAAWSSDARFGDTIGGDEEILVVRSLDGGAHWSLPIPLNANADSDGDSDDRDPRLALDNLGHCVAVWETKKLPGQGGDRDFVVTARSLDNGANWSLPVPLNTNFANNPGTEYGPTIATDGRGRWLAAWVNDFIFANPTGDSDVLISRSSDDGGNWSSPVALNTDADGDAGSDSAPELATDHRDAWVAVWQTSNAPGNTVGDPDCRTARFALPDCNNNFVADATETALGLAPDVNGNVIPDACEPAVGDLPEPPSAFNPGICGVGAAGFSPVLMVGVSVMHRSFRRRRPERKHG